MQNETIRARDLGLDLPGTPGANNAITDVAGVEVGFETLLEGEPPLRTGFGPVRTGVTAVLPRGRDPVPRPVWAGIHALNGNGEMTGSHWIKDGGYLVGPVCITNTHSVGMVHHAAVRWILDTYGEYFHKRHLWAMPVVAETYDGILNDINGQHVTPDHARRALDAAAPGPLAEGNTGGGAGMICYGFKGGTGTASRVVAIDSAQFTIAALVQANHGSRPWLSVLGVPVGRHLTGDVVGYEAELGSVIAIIATDAPLLPHQLERLARRGAIGIGRGGSPGGNGSGDMFLAFSVANVAELPQVSSARLTMEHVNDEQLDVLYLGCVEAIEESIINALVAARDMTTLRPAGQVCRAIEHEKLVEVMRRYGRAE